MELNNALLLVGVRGLWRILEDAFGFWHRCGTWKMRGMRALWNNRHGKDGMREEVAGCWWSQSEGLTLLAAHFQVWRQQPGASVLGGHRARTW